MYERLPIQARPALVRLLQQIQPDPEGSDRAYFGRPSWKVPLQWGKPVRPWEAQFVLRDIVGCEDFGRIEKLAWEFALRFEDIPMTLAFQKFGLRAYVEKNVIDEAGAEAVANRMVNTIGSAMPLLRKTVLAMIADEQIARGELNVRNHFLLLHRQYAHFRDLSIGSELAAAAARPIREELEGTLNVRFPGFELRDQARYEAKAGLNAFFSLLEHLLLIEFLLSGQDATGGLLAKFIASGWNTKFKQLLDLSDQETKVYGELRNPSVHGEVHSDGTDFDFLLPGVGPVPARLVITNSGGYRYRWTETDSSALSDMVDGVEAWLRSGPLESAVVYGDSDLPLFFGDALREDLVNARHDVAELHDLIKAIQRMTDDAANMDW